MRIKLLTRVGLSAAVTALALAGGVVKAEAAVPAGFIGRVDTVGTHGSAGTFDVGGGRVVCVQTNFQDPTGMGAQLATDTAHPHSAYALAKYINTTDKDTAAALWGYVNVTSPDGSLQQPGPGQATPAQLAANFAYLEGVYPGIATALATITADAAANAGPFSSSAFTMSLDSGSKSKGTVTDYGVMSAGGAWQGGLTGTITLNGPAVWDATGTATLSFTTTTAAQSASWHATGTGTVSATRSVVGPLPGAGGVPLFSTTNLPQIVAAVGASGTDPAQDSTQVAVFAPKVKTKASTQLATAGQTGYDTVVAYDGEPGQPWTATVDVFMSLATHPKDGITGTPTTTLTVSGVFGADGTSTVDTGKVTFTAGYTYFWEHLAATPTTPAYDSPKGTETTETVLVLPGDLKTAINKATSNVGDTLTDTVDGGTLPTTDVNGAPITYTLAGSLLRGTCGKADWDTTHPVSSFGPVAYVAGSTYGSYVVQTADAGKCLTWVETITATSPSGSTTISHAPGLTSETTTVAKSKVPGAEISTGLPLATSTLSSAQLLVGASAGLAGLLLVVGLLATRRPREAGQVR